MNIEAMQRDIYNLRQKLTKQDIEIHMLKQENDQLHKEINHFKRMEMMAATVPKYSSFHARNFQDPQPNQQEYALQLVHVEKTDLEKKLEQTEAELRQTQAELRRTQAELRQTQAELQLNQVGCKCSDVELKQMLEKVSSIQRF